MSFLIYKKINNSKLLQIKFAYTYNKIYFFNLFLAKVFFLLDNLYTKRTFAGVVTAPTGDSLHCGNVLQQPFF